MGNVVHVVARVDMAQQSIWYLASLPPQPYATAERTYTNNMPPYKIDFWLNINNLSCFCRFVASVLGSIVRFHRLVGFCIPTQYVDVSVLECSPLRVWSTIGVCDWTLNIDFVSVLGFFALLFEACISISGQPIQKSRLPKFQLIWYVNSFLILFMFYKIRKHINFPKQPNLRYVHFQAVFPE